MTAEQQAKLFQDFTLILAVLTGRTLVLLFFISALSRDAVLPAR